MIDQIKILTKQITDFLSDKDGFNTEVKMHGVSVDVIAPNGNVTSYDMYELLLYTLAVRKLGSDIELNINTDESGNKIFAINTSAKFDISTEIKKINESFIGFKHESIQSVFIGKQTSNSECPYCVMTLYKDGNWMRQDLVFAELLYAFTHELKIELDDSVYCFKKIRNITKDIQAQLKELNDK
ncbi:hypothetical protein VWJ57_03920 [Escherichia coli O157]|nr:hypothetical protein [Escherichia coli O157]